jgi:hypothetical protein
MLHSRIATNDKHVARTRPGEQLDNSLTDGICWLNFERFRKTAVRDIRSGVHNSRDSEPIPDTLHEQFTGVVLRSSLHRYAVGKSMGPALIAVLLKHRLSPVADSFQSNRRPDTVAFTRHLVAEDD